MRLTKFSVWNRNVWCRQQLPNWNTWQRFFQRFSWNLNRASWLSWWDDLKMLTSMFCCTSRSTSSPWWASLGKKRRPVSPEPADLKSGCSLINQRAKLYIPWSKMEQQKRQRRQPTINSKQRQLTVPPWETPSLRCVTRMLRNSTAQK